VSSESSCAVRLARHSQNAWARHVECVESSRVEPSGIWAIAPQALYRSCSGAVHVADTFGVQPIGIRLSLRPQTDLRPYACCALGVRVNFRQQCGGSKISYQLKNVGLFLNYSAIASLSMPLCQRIIARWLIKIVILLYELRSFIDLWDHFYVRKGFCCSVYTFLCFTTKIQQGGE